MTSAIQSVQLAFTEWLAKLLGNPTFAAQAVGNIPGSLAAEGITEDQLQYINVQQAISDACGYPGVPPAAKAALAPTPPAGYTAPPPPPPPQTYTEVVQQLQVVNNYVVNNVIDNSTNVTVGDNFSGEITFDNDVTQIEGDENVVGDGNETANIDIDLSGGAGGTATGGAGGTATGGTATSTATGGTGGPGGSGGGFGTGSSETHDPSASGAGGAGGAGGNATSGSASASADAEGGSAYADGGEGGRLGDIIINFGDDQQEFGSGDQTLPPQQYEPPQEEQQSDESDIPV